MDFDVIKSMYMLNRIHYIGKDEPKSRGGGAYLVFLNVVSLYLRESQ